IAIVAIFRRSRGAVRATQLVAGIEIQVRVALGMRPGARGAAGRGDGEKRPREERESTAVQRTHDGCARCYTPVCRLEPNFFSVAAATGETRPRRGASPRGPNTRDRCQRTR